MKKYSIVNLKCKDMSGKDSTGLAVYLGLNENKEDYFLFYDKPNNGFCRRTLTDGVSYKSVRSLSEDVKKLFVDIAKGYERQYQIEILMANLRKEERDIGYKRIDQYKEFKFLTANLSILPKELSKSDFTAVLMENLPDDIKHKMKLGGWDFDSPTAISYSSKDLYISREEILDKYIGTTYSFVYRDGYGNIRMRDECEKYKYYQSLLKSCRKELPIKAEFTETLSIGDKESLIYSACYHIPLDKDLTPDYAKKIAAKLVGKTRSLDNIIDNANARPKKRNVKTETKETNKQR